MNKRQKKKATKASLSKLLKNEAIVIGNGNPVIGTGIEHHFNIGDIVKIIGRDISGYHCEDKTRLTQWVSEHHLLLKG